MLSYILAFLTILSFIFLFYRSYSTKTYLLFILFTLPLMDLKVVPEVYGGFKTFDAISFYSFIFLFDRFITVSYSRSNLYSYLFLVLIITAVLGTLNSEFHEDSIIKILKILPIFIFSKFLVIECLNNPLFHYEVIKALKFSLVFSLIFLAVQMFVGVEFTFYSGLSGNAYGFGGAAIRYPGIFYDSQTHGQFLALGGFISLYTKIEAKKKDALLNYIIFFSTILAIIVAGSRSALGGFGIGLIVIFLLADQRTRIYGMSLVILTVVTVLVLSPESGAFSRAENLTKDYLFRQSIWEEAYTIVEEHPLLGIGIGNYQSYVSIYLQDQYLENEEIALFLDQPESGYLKILVELGFMGFGIFCIYMIIPLLGALRLLLQFNSDKRITFFVASLISWLVAFSTVYSLSDNRILIMVATILVLIIVYYTNLNHNDAHSKDNLY